MSCFHFKKKILFSFVPGECKSFKEKFMKCLRDNNFENALCRNESKEYLECRMERQVPASRDLCLLRPPCLQLRCLSPEASPRPGFSLCLDPKGCLPVKLRRFGDELYSELLAAVGTFSPVIALGVIAFLTLFSFQMCDVSFRFHSRAP